MFFKKNVWEKELWNKSCSVHNEDLKNEKKNSQPENKNFKIHAIYTFQTKLKLLFKEKNFNRHNMGNSFNI